MKDRSDLQKLKSERRFLIRLLHFENNEIVILGAEARLSQVMKAINQHEYGLELFDQVEMTTEFRTPRDNDEWHEIRGNLAEFGRKVMLDNSFARCQLAEQKHQAAKLEIQRMEEKRRKAQ